MERVADPVQGKSMADNDIGENQNPQLIQPQTDNENAENKQPELIQPTNENEEQKQQKTGENQPAQDAASQDQNTQENQKKPLIIQNPEVKEKPETKLLEPEPESTLQKIMILRRDLGFNDIPAMEMAKTLNEGLLAANKPEENAEDQTKTDDKKPDDAGSEAEKQDAEIAKGPSLNDALTKSQFLKTMEPLKPEHLDDNTFNKKIGELFTLLDLNQNQQAERAEISNLLILISGGDKQDKIKAAFKFYDTNRNNALEPNEMTEYIRGVLMLRRAGEKSTKVDEYEEDLNKKLAAAMVTKCFKDYGLELTEDKQVRGLSYKEFSQWVLNNGSGYTAKQA